MSPEDFWSLEPRAVVQGTMQSLQALEPLEIKAIPARFASMGAEGLRAAIDRAKATHPAPAPDDGDTATAWAEHRWSVERAEGENASRLQSVLYARLLAERLRESEPDVDAWKGIETLLARFAGHHYGVKQPPSDASAILAEVGRWTRNMRALPAEWRAIY